MPSIELQSTPSDRAAHVNFTDVALLLRAAVESVGCAHKVAAAAVGYHADFFCRVLAGERGITVDRLGRLPRDVQVDFVTRWAAALGLQIERRDGLGELRELAGLLAEKRVKISIERIG